MRRAAFWIDVVFWLAAGALAASGYTGPRLALALATAAVVITLWLVVTTPPLKDPLRRLGRRRPVLSTLLACVVGAAVFGTAWQFWVRFPDDDLAVSPARMTIWRKREEVKIPIKIRNRRDHDLERRAFLVRFRPSLPGLMDALFVPVKSTHAPEERLGADPRIRIVRWEEGNSSLALFLVEYVYAADTIEYQAEIKTDAFTTPVEMTTKTVDPEAYKSRDPQFALAGENEQVLRTFPQRIAALANSPTATLGILLSDGEWRTATGTYADLLPPFDQAGFSLRLYRDVDDQLKFQLRTAHGFPGGTLAFPIAEIHPVDTHLIQFGWTRTGMLMKIDGRPSVKLGVVE